MASSSEEMKKTSMEQMHKGDDHSSGGGGTAGVDSGGGGGNPRGVGRAGGNPSYGICSSSSPGKLTKADFFCPFTCYDGRGDAETFSPSLSSSSPATGGGGSVSVPTTTATTTKTPIPGSPAVAAARAGNGRLRGMLGGRPIGKLGDSTLFGSSEATSSLDWRPMSQKYAQQYEQVKQLLLQRGDLSKAVINANADAYYNHLGLNEYYFQTASAQTVASNLACVVAAKMLHEMSSSDYFPKIMQEREGEVFLLARASLRNRKASQNYQVEREIEKNFLGLQGAKGEQAYRMQCYRSTGSFFDDPGDDTERLRTYFLQLPEYAAPAEEVDPQETDLAKVLDVYFYANKQNTATAEIYRRLNEDDSVTMWGFYSQRKYVEPLANGVCLMTTFIEELPEDQLREYPAMSISQRVEHLVKAIRMQYIMKPSRFTELAQERLLTVHEAAYALAATKFIQHFAGTVGPAFGGIEKMVKHFGAASQFSQQELYELRTRLKVPPFSEDTLIKTVEQHTDIVKRLYEEFEHYHHPRVYNERDCQLLTWEEETPLKRDIQRLDSPDAPPVLLLFRMFTASIVRTNFWKDVKQGLTFRMHPVFLPAADYPDKPFAVIFIVGPRFMGFHVRFAAVARGGVRVVQSFTTQSYQRNRETAFDEVYKLANTQNLKNKDIPEGGSKGVILLDRTDTHQAAEKLTQSAFKAYIDSILDVLLPDAQVVPPPSSDEILFLGPDEHTGTGGLMDWAARRARERGASFWRAFTTGKQPVMGGIPHDVYGMTTASIETYIRGILAKKSLKEEQVTRFLVGGPDGDLGSNALLKSHTKTTTVVDGSGVLHDPLGLDLSELQRLAKRRFQKLETSAMMYDSRLLSPNGFKVAQDERDVTLPDGTMIASGFQFRNDFHLNPRVSADLFNPCGGRPASVTPFNVEKMLNDKGEPRFKYIVEGANVFITDEARRILEEKGVILFKDASTNKGGVTSSSHEVLAALALTDEEFAQHMQVTDPAHPPPFYVAYVHAVLERIRENANLEFTVLWNESLRTGKPRCDLTDLLSEKILRLKKDIQKSDTLWSDEQLVRRVLMLALPEVLVPGLLDIETLRKRVPEPYLRAIFQSYLASRFYYSQPFSDDLSAFAFFDYIEQLKRGKSRKEEGEVPAALKRELENHA